MAGGPLPRYIYWRRRLMALAVAILLIWLIVQVVGWLNAPKTTSSPGAQASSSASAKPKTEPKAKEGAVEETPVSLNTASTACDPSQISSLVWVPGNQVIGGPVTIDVTFTNATAKPCTLNPDDARLIAVISSGGAPVYDSELCQADLLTEPVVIAGEWATQVPVSWTGRGSGTGCAPTEPFAAAGNYTVRVGTFGGEPSEAQFTLLSAPPSPTPSPTPATPAPSAAAGSPAPAADGNVYGTEASPAPAQ